MQVKHFVALVVALGTAATICVVNEQSRASTRKTAKLVPSAEGRKMESDQWNSLPTTRTHKETNSGEFHTTPGPRERATRTLELANEDDDDDDFIRVDRNVETGVRLPKRPQSVARQQMSPSTRPIAQKVQTSTSKLENESSSERSVALESLNRFLLERPSRIDKTRGALLGSKLSLDQHQQFGQLVMVAAAQRAPPPTTTTTTTAAQVDQLTRLYLDSNTPLEVRVHLGETAYLLCRLRANLDHSDKLRVSWFKKYEMLTSGELRYTSDERFRSSHQEGDWLLELRNVRESDQGDYECQVNTTPRSVSLKVRLVVIKAKVKILEGSELKVAVGQPLELTCLVQFKSQSEFMRDETEGQNDQSQTEQSDEQFPEEPKRRRKRRQTSSAAATSLQPYIYWYKDQVYLKDERVQAQRFLNATSLEKVLRVDFVSSTHSGNYTCKLVPELAGVKPAQVQVQVTSSSYGFSKQEPANLLLVTAVCLISLILQKHHFCMQQNRFL